MHKKILIVIGITILFIGVSFQPVFAVNIKSTDETIVETDLGNNEKVEYVIQIIKTNKVVEYVIYLTRQQEVDLESLINNICADLNNSESLEETSEIYDDAVDSFSNIGLFPEDVSVGEIKDLVSGRAQNFDLIKSKYEMSTGFKNNLCYVFGESTMTYFLRPVFSLFTFILPIGAALKELGYLLFPFFPFRIGYNVVMGETSWSPDGSKWYYYPVHGWIATDGLNGKLEWNGDFYGDLYHIGGIISEHYVGVLGFTGFRIGKNGDSSVDYFGFALKAAITTSV